MFGLQMRKQHIFFLIVALCIVTVTPSLFQTGAAAAGSENTWEEMATLPTARDFFSVAVAGGQIWAVGGDVTVDQTASSHTSVVESYNPSNNAWRSGYTAMPVAWTNFPAAAYQDKIYCFCQTRSNPGYVYDTASVYHSVNNPWSAIAQMPKPVLGSASQVGGKIYVVGIYSERAGLSSNLNQMYDPATNTWTLKAPSPIPVSYSVSVVLDGKIYVFGTTSDCNATQIYDPQSNSWKVGPSMPFTLTFGSGGATTGIYAPKRIYLFGQEGTLVFDPQTETWSTGATVPESITSFGVGVVNDALYLIGGRKDMGQRSVFGQTYEKYDRVGSVYKYTPFGYHTTPLPELSVSIVSPVSNQTYFSSSINLVYSVNRQSTDITQLSYSLNWQTAIPLTGNTTLTNLPNGSHNLTVYATDSLENTAASKTVNFTIAQQPTPTPSATTTPSASVPEFPTWIVAALAVTAVAVVTYAKGKKKQY